MKLSGERWTQPLASVRVASRRVILSAQVSDLAVSRESSQRPARNAIHRGGVRAGLRGSQQDSHNKCRPPRAVGGCPCPLAEQTRVRGPIDRL